MSYHTLSPVDTGGIGRGLIALFVPVATSFQDRAPLSRRAISTVAATAQDRTLGRQGVAATAWANAATTDLEFLTGQWSVWCLAEMTGTVTDNISFYQRFTYTSESVNAGHALYFDTSGSGRIEWRVYANNGAASYVLAGTTASAVVGTQHLVGTSDGANRRLYIGGKLNASGTANLNPATTTAGLNIGNTTNGQYVYRLGFWNRVLSPEEVLTLKVNPNAIFLPPSNRWTTRYVTPAAGGASYRPKRRLMLLGVQ